MPDQQPTPELSLTIPPRDHTPPDADDAATRLDITATMAAIRDRARANGLPQPGQSPAERAAERERAAAAQRARQRASDAVAGIPTRFRGGHVEHPAVRAWVDATAAGAGESLVMLGGVGTGKTHQAFAAWAELVNAGHFPDAQWLAMPAWLDGLRPGREPTVDYDAAAGARLLLLDDLAAERGSEWTVEVVYRLLDHRYAWQLPTIITTNVTDIRTTMGDRIASRLNGMGDRVTFDGPDRRTRPAGGSPAR